MGLFGLRSKEQRFWDWFTRNSQRVRHLEADQEVILGELTRALHKVDDSLAFEIGPDESPRELCISADGLRELIPAVEKLVAAAPNLPEWKVIAFRQPGDADVEIMFRGRTLSVDDIWFSASQGGGRTDIELFVRELTEEDFEPLVGAVFLLLDNLLGEYVVMTRVGEIDWDALPDDPAAAGLKPFIELRDVFGVSTGEGS